MLMVGTVLALSASMWAADPPTTPPQDQPNASPSSNTDQGTPSSEMESGAANMNNTNAGRCYSVTEVIGREVQGQDNEKLGKIEDLAINPKTGKVQYVVLSLNGTTGSEGKLLPVPWMAFKHVSAKSGETVQAAGHCMINVDKNTLAKAPTFQKGQWPDFSDSRWTNAINQFYNPIIAKQSNEGYTR
jgi:sporulation protein YlmC with PRC-barrel domain